MRRRRASAVTAGAGLRRRLRRRQSRRAGAEDGRDRLDERRVRRVHAKPHAVREVRFEVPEARGAARLLRAMMNTEHSTVST